MKRYRRGFLLFYMLVTVLLPMEKVAASVTKSYTISVDGELIETQTAYEAVGIVANLAIQRPEDLFIDENNYLYVVDSEKNHVVVLDPNGELIRTIGEEDLDRPTGVAVNDQGEIFVASTNYVFKFSETGMLLEQFGRPDSPLFGSNQPFNPQKISLDARGNMYIVGAGASNGIIQLNADGEFLGYFGANRTTFTFFQALQNFMMSNGNQSGRFMNLPPTPTNLAINERGIVFTVTSGLRDGAVRKLNIAGSNMLNNILATDRAVDVAIGNQGNFYVLSSEGLIFEYDSVGNLLFIFGGEDPTSQRLGVFRQPTSLAVDNEGNIYVADAESGLIHYLIPTEFTQKVHRGLAYFEEGMYIQSEEYWDEVLKLNSSFALAHVAIGQSQFKQLEYEEALERFELADDRNGYSEAFWEIRNEWLQHNTATGLMILLIGIILWKLVKYVDKTTTVFEKFKQVMKKVAKVNIVKEFALMRKILRHPLDTYYDIRYLNKGSVLSASLLYVIFFLVIFFSLYAPGFIFTTNVIENLGFLIFINLFLGAVALFVVINYLVSTINDGEGSFKKVYIGTIYAMAPYIIFALPITLLSQVLTENEAFVYEFSMQIMICWSLILLFIMVKEVHDYSIRDTIKNLLLTLFGSLITVIVLVILYLLLNQVFEFIYAIIQEVLVRV